MNQPSEAEKNSILSRILRSPEFHESKRYQELLQYLVAKSASVDSLKETEIAQEVFGKDSKFDPASDPLIRSYVSNLRKKLEHYYLTTDQQFDYKIDIPKGQYLVRYVKVTRSFLPQKARAFLPKAYLAVIVILVGVLIYREVSNQGTSGSGSSTVSIGPIWNEFVQPGARPTLIVLGDYFFLRERADSGSYYRKGKINSLDEYLHYVMKNPDFGKKYVMNSFTYLRPSAPWGLAKILPMLQGNSANVALKLASQFTPDDFRKNNVIFIGSFRTLNVLRNFLHIFKLEYSTTPPSSFAIRDGIGDSVHVFRPAILSAGNFEKDYGVVAKGEGPDGSHIVMLLGFSEGGVIQAAQAAGDPMFLETLAEVYPQAQINPKLLTVVTRAEGMTQSLFKAEIQYVAGIGTPDGRNNVQADAPPQSDTLSRNSP
jgi:hypothetical protein